MDRHLSGVYVRIQRDGKWENVDYTDLTPEEREAFMRCKANGANYQWWVGLANTFADIIRDLGEQFDLARD